MFLVSGVSDFIDRSLNTLSKFESVVNQIQKNEQDIDSKLQSMATANLLKFPIPDESNDLPGRISREIVIFLIVVWKSIYKKNLNLSSLTCFFWGVKEFCKHIEQERNKTVCLLSQKYSDIGPLIIKIENLVMDTSSGKAKCMQGYYMDWECKALDCLTKMVLR